MSHRKVIIVGAGRSGTNMLRDIIEQFPEVTTWDCDEINAIWRYGNASFATDELQVSDVKNKTRRLVERAFSAQSKRCRAPIVLEKTCANSLRVPFVFDLCPDAKYIFIFRDGRDVVSSAMKRWVSRLDFSYTIKKMKYVPFLDFPYYLFKFGLNRVKRLLFGNSQLSFWGPIYNGMEQDVARFSLAEVCAKQWSKCVSNTVDSIEVIPEDQRLSIKYEDFVDDPESYVRQIGLFLGCQIPSDKIVFEMVKGVSNKSVGIFKRNLSISELEVILPLCHESMMKLGYNIN